MIPAQKPATERERLAALQSYQILDTEAESEFDDLARLASEICGTPIALISLIDAERQWFKARVGLENCQETDREWAFCAHAILQDELFEVEDASEDERFSDNPLVRAEPNIRFYAGTPLITADGYPLGTLCTISDQPKTLDDFQRRALKTLGREVVARLELRKKNLQLAQASEFKTLFISNVSHEIRTPLNGVLGLANLLLRTPLSDQQKQYAGSIQRSGEALLRIINDVLDLSRVESGKLEIESVEFDLNLLVSDVVDCFSMLADEKGIRLQNRVRPRNKMLKGDPHRIRQILSNLVSNAIKFTETGGVEISDASRHPRGDLELLKLTVTDTGVGISEEQKQQLFSRFQQAAASTSRHYGGSGLGLSISKQLCELMRGEIGVKSAPGRGSSFWFALPLHTTDVEIVREEVVDDTAAELLRYAGRVLVAEDNRVNQIVIRGLLQEFGLDVDCVENGALAISKLKSNVYDLILMDCQMPVMDGYEAVANIHSTNSMVLNPNTPIAAMTANAMESDRQACRDAGMDDFLPKPIETEALGLLLKRWLTPVEVADNVDQAEVVSAPEVAEVPSTALDAPTELHKVLQYAAFKPEWVEQLQLSSDYLENVYRVFWNNAPQEINELSQALIRQDLAAAGRVAHSIKGSARMLGGERLWALANFIEQQAAAGVEMSPRQLMGYLENCLDEFRTAVNDAK